MLGSCVCVVVSMLASMGTADRAERGETAAMAGSSASALLSASAESQTLPSGMFLVQEEGEFDGLKYKYFVGWLNAEKTKKYRAVFGSLGSVAVAGEPARKIGIDAPQLAGGSTADLDVRVIQEGDNFRFQLLSGWGGAEFFDAEAGSSGSTSGGSTGIGTQPSPLLRLLLPISWRFITTDGIRTGANSSRFFVVAGLKGAGATGVQSACFADHGDVTAALELVQTGAPRTPGTIGRLDPGSDLKMKVGTVAKQVKQASGASEMETQDTPKVDADQFVAQARRFLQRAKERHEK